MIHGMILYKYEGYGNELPGMGLIPEDFIPFLWSWLADPESLKVEQKDWDRFGTHDGSNEAGWRVYCEDWGHVANESSAFCAVKPVYLWLGK